MSLEVSIQHTTLLLGWVYPNYCLPNKFDAHTTSEQSDSQGIFWSLFKYSLNIIPNNTVVVGNCLEPTNFEEASQDPNWRGELKALCDNKT